jgi:hypothetical protein
MIFVKRVPKYQLKELREAGENVASCRWDVENHYKKINPDAVIRSAASGWVVFENDTKFRLWEEANNVLPPQN